MPRSSANQQGISNRTPLGDWRDEDQASRYLDEPPNYQEEFSDSELPSYEQVNPSSRVRSQRDDFAGFNRASLYNHDMYGYLMNAYLGPVVEADVTISISPLTERKVWKFSNFVEIKHSRLQDELMCLQAGLTYYGKDVILTQKYTLAYLLAINCFWDAFNRQGNTHQWRYSRMPLSSDIRKYLGGYLDNVKYNDDGQTVTFLALANLVQLTRVPGVKIGKISPTAISDTPGEIADQLRDFLDSSISMAGAIKNYEDYMRDRLVFLEDFSPSLRNYDVLSDDAYTLIPLYDNYIAKMAYHYTSALTDSQR